MMKKKIIVTIICILFFGTGIIPAISGYKENIDKSENDDYKNLIKQVIKNGVISKNNWIEQDKLFDTNGDVYDYFGDSVSIDGDYAVIGACLDDDNGDCSGSAYIFKREGTNWNLEDKLTASDGESQDSFGYSVSISGDTAIIGAYGDDDNGGGSGSAYVFKRAGTTWIQQAKLLASDGASGDLFGWSVSIDDSYAIIGSYSDDNDKGSAYIFKYTGSSTWTQQAKLVASDGAVNDIFGYSVSISADRALIGAPMDENQRGSAYVFIRDGSLWPQEDKLFASDGKDGDYFGMCVSLQGEYLTAIVGAPYDDAGKGSAYIFKGFPWTYEYKLTVTDCNAQFGHSVSICDGYAVVGAPLDYVTEYEGSAYIFKETDTIWIQDEKLSISDGSTETGDQFGYSVSIDEETVLIGAPQCELKGAAYVFTKDAEPEDFYFVHIADLHYAYNGFRDKFKNVINKINNLEDIIGFPPLFVAITGDLLSFGNGCSPDPLSLYRFYNLYEEENCSYDVLKSDLSKLNVPYFVIPGNHDNYMFFWFDPWVCTGLDSYNTAFPDSTCPRSFLNSYFDINLLLIHSGCDELIASCRDPPRGLGLSDDDMNWLDNNLLDTTYKIILMHHPTVNYGTCHRGVSGWDVGCIHNNREVFRNWCGSNDVDLVLAGHTHVASSYYASHDGVNEEGISIFPAYSSDTIFSTIYWPESNDSIRIIYSDNSIGELAILQEGDVSPPFAEGKNVGFNDHIIAEGSLISSSNSAFLHLYDDMGNHVGINDTGGIECNIDNATQLTVPIDNASEYNYNAGFFMWNDTRETISNSIDGRDYTYTIDAFSEGFINFTFEEQIAHRKSIKAFYKNIFVTSQTKGMLNIDGDAVDFTIYMDDDDDGFTDREIEPSYFERPPEKPSKPIGESEGKVGEIYSFESSAVDPDGDQVKYLWDWGDGNYSGWLGPYDSGDVVEADYSWEYHGVYSIRVKAIDSSFRESDWSDPLTITVKKSKDKAFSFNFNFLEWLFERFPNAFPILRQLLGLLN